MKYLTKYKIFEKESIAEDIEAICKEYKIENYTINADGSIDVDDDVNLYNYGFVKLPLKFNRVTGDFVCNENALTSLLGAPNHVDGDFYCADSFLRSLEGCPNYVGKRFSCSRNDLTSLKGGPSHVGSFYYCHNNNLTSLEGIPKHLYDDFYCQHNYLTSLEYMPSVDGIINLDSNPVNLIVNHIMYREDRDNLIELFNDMDIVQGNNVIYDRLKYFFEGIDIELGDGIIDSGDRISSINHIAKYYKIVR